MAPRKYICPFSLARLVLLKAFDSKNIEVQQDTAVEHSTNCLQTCNYITGQSTNPPAIGFGTQTPRSDWDSNGLDIMVVEAISVHPDQLPAALLVDLSELGSCTFFTVETGHEL